MEFSEQRTILLLTGHYGTMLYHPTAAIDAIIKVEGTGMLWWSTEPIDLHEKALLHSSSIEFW